MYHFMATCAPEPLELSERVQIPGHIRQYLRDFQLDTLHFLHKRLTNRDFCILNDESGLGKCVSTAVYLGSIAKNGNTLLVVQNDDELVSGWQLHFEVLTNLSVGVLAANTSTLDPLPNIIIAKWATLRTNIDVSKYNFDYVIIDNRGEMMSNNFCMSMLLSNYEHKVNLLISSIDVASDLKLLHNCLRLGGHLEHQYEQFKNFEAKYKLPSSKDVLNKTADLEQYFLKREMISDYCKDFRLRRYRYQYEDQLPIVDLERYKISLELWRTISSSNSSQRSNDNTNNLNANSETATEELFNQAQALDNEVSQIIESRKSICANTENNEASEDAFIMSPLLIDSESCSSDEPEVVNVANPAITMKQNKQTEPDIYEFVDLSMDQNSDEYTSAGNLEKQTLKTNEPQSNPRSLTQQSNNEKTSVKNVTSRVDNVMKLIGKKTKFESSKETLVKKTIEQDGENSKAINNCIAANTKSSTDYQNQPSLKKQAKNKSQKQYEFSKNDKSFAADAESNRKESLIATRRRRVNRSEEISQKTHKNLNSAVNDENLSKEKSKKTLNKRKSGDIDDNTKNVGNVSPAKRPSLKYAVSNLNETTNKKANTDNNKDVENKKIAQPNEDNAESSPRRLRQSRGGVQTEKCSGSTAKYTRAAKTTKNTTPTNNTVKCDLVKDYNSSSNAKQNSTEKRKQKGSPKNRSRAEIPQTPTSRSTRSMQRLTRSADNTKSKYMRSSLVLEENRKQKKRRGRPNKDKQEEEGSKSLNTSTTSESKKNKERDRHTRDNRDGEDAKSSNMEAAIESKKRKDNNAECGKSVGGKIILQHQTMTPNKQIFVETFKHNANSTDLSLLPCSQNTEDMQCGQKIITDTHSDNGFLRPPTPTRFVRNSEHKNFLSTPSSFVDSEVVFLPPPDTPNKTQQVVVLSSSTDDGSYSSQQSVHSRRTRALKQKKSVKRTDAERSERSTGQTSAPTFGELLAKQQIQRKSPDIFSASTDLGLTCTQQRDTGGDGNPDTDTFQGFKIFGSEVKQIQQQHANQPNGKRSTQVLSRDRSCLNILEKMFDPHATDGPNDTQAQQTNKTQQMLKKKPDGRLVKRTTRGTQPVVPTLPNTTSTTATVTTQLPQTHDKCTKSKQKQNHTTQNPIIIGPMVDEEIFEITNNDAFGSVMRINSNGEISPVHTTTRTQQPTQHNKITNYLIGSTQLMPTEATVEERTPNKRTQMQLSGTVTRRSPKSRLTQTTKLTKWFQKNDVTVNDTHPISEQDEIRLGKHTRSAMAKRLKRRCLELSFRN